MAEGTLAAGGALIPAPLSSRIIDKARAQARVSRLGAQFIPMTTATLDVPRLVTDPVPGWRAENSAVITSDAAFDRVSLKARDLHVIVPMSVELWEDSDPGVGNVVAEAPARVFALELDRVTLYGTGSANNQPLGIVNTAGILTGPTPAANTLNTAPDNWDPIVNGVVALRSNSEDPNGVLMSPALEGKYALLKEATTNAPLAVPPYLDGITRTSSGNLPATLANGTSAATGSDLFIADWRMLAIGVRVDFTIRLLVERYADLGQVGLEARMRIDSAPLRPKAFYVHRYVGVS